MNTQEQIEEIIDWFDFHKVHKVMEFLDWQWKDQGVPGIGDLRKKAREYIKVAVIKCNEPEGEYSVRCGGFHVKVNKYEGDEKVYIKLAFELEDWDNYD